MDLSLLDVGAPCAWWCGLGLDLHLALKRKRDGGLPARCVSSVLEAESSAHAEMARGRGLRGLELRKGLVTGASYCSIT